MEKLHSEHRGPFLLHVYTEQEEGGRGGEHFFTLDNHFSKLRSRDSPLLRIQCEARTEAAPQYDPLAQSYLFQNIRVPPARRLHGRPRHRGYHDCHHALICPRFLQEPWMCTGTTSPKLLIFGNIALSPYKLVLKLLRISEYLSG